MIANIASYDALILPHRANPTGLNFRERQGQDLIRGSSLAFDIPMLHFRKGQRSVIRHSIRQQSGVVAQPPRLGNPLGNPVQGCGAIPMDRQVK